MNMNEYTYVHVKMINWNECYEIEKVGIQHKCCVIHDIRWIGLAFFHVSRLWRTTFTFNITMNLEFIEEYAQSTEYVSVGKGTKCRFREWIEEVCVSAEDSNENENENEAGKMKQYSHAKKE